MEDIFDYYEDDRFKIKMVNFFAMLFCVLGFIFLIFLGKKAEEPKFKAQTVSADDVQYQRNKNIHIWNIKDYKKVDPTKTYVHLEVQYKKLREENYISLDSLSYMKCRLEEKIRSRYTKEKQIQSDIKKALQNNCN